MKKRGVLVIFAAVLMGTGCSAEVDSIGGDLVTHQTRFDFTVRADRDLFTEEGMEFTGSVGPYAVYNITGDNPRLVGPRVTHDRVRDGLVMLCGASNYFAPVRDAEDTEMTLQGGAEGEDEIVSARTEALMFDDCSEADDSFSERPESEPAEAELFLVDGEQLVVEVSPEPMIGSQVLIRIASLSEAERDHNDSHVIPAVCCDGSFCALE